jgi:hypothetical protein
MWSPLQDYARRIAKIEAFDGLMLQKLKDLREILGTFGNATASLESDEFGTISWIYDWPSLLQETCRPIGDRWEVMAKGWSDACTHWRGYLGKNEGQARDIGWPLPEGVGLTDRVVAAALLNPGCACERSLSPGNQRLGLMLSVRRPLKQEQQM